MAKRNEPLKKGRLEFRISAEDEEALDYLVAKKGMTKAQIVREGILMQYKLEKTIDDLYVQDD